MDGLYNVGYMMAAGRGGDKDEEGAVQYYERAAKKGFVPAMYSLGLCYANETGASLDDALAVKWYRKAADKVCSWSKPSLRGNEWTVLM